MNLKRTLEQEIKDLRDYFLYFGEGFDDRIVPNFDNMIKNYDGHENLEYLIHVIKVSDPLIFDEKERPNNLIFFFLEISQLDTSLNNKILRIINNFNYGQCSKEGDYPFEIIFPTILNYKESENLENLIDIFGVNEIEYSNYDDLKVIESVTSYFKGIDEENAYTERLILDLMKHYSKSISNKMKGNYMVFYKTINNFKEEPDFPKFTALLIDFVRKGVGINHISQNVTDFHYILDYSKKFNNPFNNGETFAFIDYLEEVSEHINNLEFVRSLETIVNLSDMHVNLITSSSSGPVSYNMFEFNFYKRLNYLVKLGYSNPQNSHKDVEKEINLWLKNITNEINKDKSMIDYQIVISPQIKDQELKKHFSDREINKLREAYELGFNYFSSNFNLVSSNSDDFHPLYSAYDNNFFQALNLGLENYSTIEEKRKMVYGWSNNVVKLIRERPCDLFEYFSIEVNER